MQEQRNTNQESKNKPVKAVDHSDQVPDVTKALEGIDEALQEPDYDSMLVCPVCGLPCPACAIACGMDEMNYTPPITLGEYRAIHKDRNIDNIVEAAKELFDHPLTQASMSGKLSGMSGDEWMQRRG